MIALCPQRCGHDAYDLACSDYSAQPCCGYVTNTEDLGDSDNHETDCKNVSEWMRL